MNQVSLAEVLGSVRGPLFLARQGGHDTRPTLSLHTTERRAGRTILRQARAALAAAGVTADCSIVVHRPSALTRARSLEGLLKRLGKGEIVFDPTQFVGRSEAVCDFAAQAAADPVRCHRGLVRRRRAADACRRGRPAEISASGRGAPRRARPDSRSDRRNIQPLASRRAAQFRSGDPGGFRTAGRGEADCR